MFLKRNPFLTKPPKREDVPSKMLTMHITVNRVFGDPFGLDLDVEVCMNNRDENIF